MSTEDEEVSSPEPVVAIVLFQKGRSNILGGRGIGVEYTHILFMKVIGGGSRIKILSCGDSYPTYIQTLF